MSTDGSMSPGPDANGDAGLMTGGDAGSDGSTEVAWSIVPPPTFVAGSAGVYDLAATLPPGVAKGGVFAVDPSGAALPAGMMLAQNGQLSLGSATVGMVAGVIFSYEAP